ncbi:hypothetical protein FOA52_003807 [Chlamydomonas sp. UWO 241]|nr:hypothetical protein FOA52_003807 [Chlamydomonas sp. UWO 241]
MQMPHAVPHAAHSAPRAAPAAKAAEPARPAAAAAPVASAGGAPAAERPAAAGAARAASARGPSRRGGLPARVGETSLCRSHVLSIPVAAATRLIAGRGSEGQMARDGIVRGALRDASYLGSTRHVRRLFSDCYGSEETAVAAAAVRVAAAAVDGVSLPVCLAMNLVRFVHDVSGRDRPAGGGVVSASFLNAKPAVGGIGVEPRRGGVLRVLFTVASDAVADTVVRSRRNLRDVDPSAAPATSTANRWISLASVEPICATRLCHAAQTGSTRPSDPFPAQSPRVAGHAWRRVQVVNQNTRVATFNVRTCPAEDEGLVKLASLVQDCAKFSVGVAALQELRRTGSGEAQVATGDTSWTLLWSGGEHRQRGVGLLLSPAWASALVSWEAVSDRLIQARFAADRGQMITIVSAYSPTEAASDEEAGHFYLRVAALADKANDKRDLLIVAGGSQRRAWDSSQLRRPAVRREFNLQLSDRFGLLEAVPPEGADAQAEYDAMAAAIREAATNHLAPRGSRRRHGWQFTLSQRTLRLMDARQRAHTAWLRSKSAAAKRERNRANRAADAAVQRDRERWIGQQVAEAQDMLRKKNLRQFARACDRLAGRSRSHQIPPAMRDVSGALHSGPDGVLKAMTESFDKLYGGETKLSDETLNQLENDVAAFELTRATEVDEAHGRPLTWLRRRRAGPSTTAVK